VAFGASNAPKAAFGALSAPKATLGRSVLETVVAVIGERTGYPVEMIEPDLDLEADLSVDSIKRAEIAGELASRLGLAGGDVEEFAKARTAAAIAELIGDEPAEAPAVTSVLETVVEVIGERTGYPVEMIEPDLDLEADLSIDSIKRAEIAGELAARLNLDPSGDVEELAKARTAAAIAELLGPERPNVAFGALNAPKAAFGALDATKATLGLLAPSRDGFSDGRPSPWKGPSGGRRAAPVPGGPWPGPPAAGPRGRG
jgi:acyl carrier protein